MTSTEIKDRIINQGVLASFNQENFYPNSFGMGSTGTIFRIIEWLDDTKASAYVHKDYTVESLAKNEAEVKIISAGLFKSTEGKAYKFIMNLFAPEDEVAAPVEIIVEDTDDEIPDNFFDDDEAPMTKVERDLMERAVALDAEPREGMPLAEVVQSIQGDSSEFEMDTTPEIVDDEIPEAQEILEGLRTGAWEGNLRSKTSKFYDYLYWHGPVTSAVLYDYMKHLGITKTVGTKADALALVKELNNAGWDARVYEDRRIEFEWGIGPYCEQVEAPEYATKYVEASANEGEEFESKPFAYYLEMFGESQPCPVCVTDTTYNFYVPCNSCDVEASIKVKSKLALRDVE